jgi:hypothetical protein
VRGFFESSGSLTPSSLNHQHILADTTLNKTMKTTATTILAVSLLGLAACDKAADTAAAAKDAATSAAGAAKDAASSAAGAAKDAASSAAGAAKDAAGAATGAISDALGGALGGSGLTDIANFASIGQKLSGLKTEGMSGELLGAVDGLKSKLGAFTSALPAGMPTDVKGLTEMVTKDGSILEKLKGLLPMIAELKPMLEKVKTMAAAAGITLPF